MPKQEPPAFAMVVSLWQVVSRGMSPRINNGYEPLAGGLENKIKLGIAACRTGS
jgi:hypothetical protein